MNKGTNKLELSWQDVAVRAEKIAKAIFLDHNGRPQYAFPVPNGGIPAALAIQGAYNQLMRAEGYENMSITDKINKATIVLDDVIDSGATRDRFAGKPFYALVDKLHGIDVRNDHWVVFPWERAIREEGPEDSVRRFLQYIGEDCKREGLLQTPSRVVKSWKELFSGYEQDPANMLTVFEDGACDEQVILRNVEFTSHCEHHCLPFFGHAHIAYVPDKKVIGVSKLVRLLEIYSKRLQIQERLCQQVTTALDTHLQPKGSACIITAKHLCMVCRGVQKQHSEMVTSSLTGAYRSDTATRLELMSLIQ